MDALLIEKIIFQVIKLSLSGCFISVIVWMLKRVVKEYDDRNVVRDQKDAKFLETITTLNDKINEETLERMKADEDLRAHVDKVNARVYGEHVAIRKQLDQLQGEHNVRTQLGSA